MADGHLAAYEWGQMFYLTVNNGLQRFRGDHPDKQPAFVLLGHSTGCQVCASHSSTGHAYCAIQSAKG
jgi:hypothetical protein